MVLHQRLGLGLGLGLTLLLLTLAAGRGLAAAPHSAGGGFGSRIVFHGWSLTSRYIAYTRTRRRPPKRRGGAPRVDVQRMHREVRGGVFTSFGSQVGGDVAAWARDHHYFSAALPVTRESVGRFVFDMGGAPPLVLELVTGARLGWRLSRAGEVLAEHTFDTIYVDVAADIYPSPDGRQGVLVMHLDTGWMVDAAVYPIWLGSLAAPATKVEAAGPRGAGQN